MVSGSSLCTAKAMPTSKPFPFYLCAIRQFRERWFWETRFWEFGTSACFPAPQWGPASRATFVCGKLATAASVEHRRESVEGHAAAGAIR